jgi:hypothetical protein
MRRPTEPFHPEWNGFAQRSTVPPFRGAGGTTPQAKVQEAAPHHGFLPFRKMERLP